MSGKFVVRLIKIGLITLAFVTSTIVVYVALALLLRGDSIETAIASLVNVETVIAIAMVALFLVFAWGCCILASRADDRMGRE